MKVNTKEINKQNGITLIALVITIIVLLILAGVSIALLTGDNGILNKASKAKEETIRSSKEEEIALQKAAEVIDKITQVSDSNPGKSEGSGTSQDPYTISSIEDLIVFSYDVTNGRDFENEYVELKQSLDFKSDKSYIDIDSQEYSIYGYNGKLKETIEQTGFIPIGGISFNSHGEVKEETSFKGDFNGNGYKIYNLKINQKLDIGDNYWGVGMFVSNTGKIENLGIENAYINVDLSNLKYSSVAILAGVNYGEINNCYSKGETKTVSSYHFNSGGLVGSNNGYIKNSYNESNVNAIVKLPEVRAGGLVGVNEPTGEIENSYNTGSVTLDSTTSNAGKTFLGGIAGRNLGKIKNTYTIGKLYNQKNEKIIIKVGSITGSNESEAINSYYLINLFDFISGEDTIIDKTGVEKNEIGMKESNFIDEINKDNKSVIWKLDSSKNNGYPILYWQ